MKYFAANTQSGRIIAPLEGDDDANEIELGYTANNGITVVYVENGEFTTPESKWYDTSSNTAIDKTQVALTYSHPHTEMDFFSEVEIPGITDPETGDVVTISRGDIPEEETLVVLNDYDLITVPANTVVTISDIPNDGDTYIFVDEQPVDYTDTLTLTITQQTLVDIDSPKYYDKIIDFKVG
mgnify:CR=1 FL=1